MSRLNIIYRILLPIWLQPIQIFQWYFSCWKLMLSPFAIRDDDTDFTHQKSTYQLNNFSKLLSKMRHFCSANTFFCVSFRFLFAIITAILVWFSFLDFYISLSVE